MIPVELALGRATRILLPALGASVLLLLVPQPGDPLGLFIAHLTGLVLFGLVLADRLAEIVGPGWFEGTGWSPTVRTLASVGGVTALVTGAVALLTLASAAALRFDPSLQFLQLLSALDIAWSGAAVVVGARLGWGKTAGRAAGLVLGAACIWSIYRYLDVVGFDASGGWIVSGGDLVTYVLPYDMVAAVAAIAMALIGSRRAQRTVQARPQS